ncbi:unnamed protein product [Prorocentrum cordatum]|uniref:Sulfotransferase n=1 Tax=Prorocentrum cordatum TaxID=2364126 RepID=A0ABN9SYI1_9DINO|nr:unnamed protein product [Polarella glacialis]
MAVSSGLRPAPPWIILAVVLAARPLEGGAGAGPRCGGCPQEAAGEAEGCCGAGRLALDGHAGCPEEDSLQPVSFRQLAVGFRQLAARERPRAVRAAAGGALLRGRAAERNASGLRGDGGDSKEIFVLHVGKTGGTSVYKSLGPALASDVQLRSHAASREELHTCADHANHGYVYFVRAPIQRYVSGWISRFRMGGRQHFNIWSFGELKAFYRFRSPDELGCALSSSSAQRRASAREAMNSIQHVMWSLTNYWGGLENFENCVGSNAFVGRFEHMQEDYERLVDMLASRNSLAQEPDANISQYHSTPAQYDGFRHLGECARANLRHWYREDYELFDRLAARGLLPEAYPAEARASDEEAAPARPLNWLALRTTWMVAACVCVAVAGLAALGLLATGAGKGRGSSVWRCFLWILWASVLLGVPCGFMVVLLQ